MPANPFADGLSVNIGADTGGFEDAIGGAMGKLGDFKKSVGLAGGALAALSAGALAKATQSAISFESQLADLEKVTSAEMVAPLKQGIMDLSEQIPMAREGLTDLAVQAGKFGAESEEEIMGFVEAVGKITSATDLAADEAGTRFAKIAGAIGMPMDEIDKLGNAVNSLADSMKTDAGEITDTATRASNILSQQLGLGQDTVLALSASMNEVSSSSRLAASSLRRMAETMMDPRKMGDMAAAVDMTKDEFKAMVKMEPEKLMNRLAQAMKENGRGADILRSTIGKAANDFNKLASQTEQTAKAQGVVNKQFEEGTSLNREMAIRTDTFSGKMQLLSNKVQNAATRIGDRLLPHLSKLLDVVIRGVEWFGRINEKTDGFAGMITLIGGVVAGAVAALGSLISVLGASTAAAAAATGAAGALGTAFTVLAGPVGIAVALIAGLAVAWKKNLFDIQGKTKAVMQFLRSAIQSGMQFISGIWAIHSDALGSETGETFTHIQNVITDFVAWARPYVQATLEALSSFWDSHGDTIMQIVDLAFSAIKATIGTSLDAVLTIVRATLALIRGDFGDFTDIVTGFVERLVDRVVGLFQKLKQLLIGGSIIPDMLSSIISAVKSWSLTGAFRGVLSSAASAVRGEISSIVGSVKSALSRVRSIGSRISSAVSSARSRASSAVSGIRSRIPGLQSGGFIESGGLAELHAGERVVPAAQVDRGGGGVVLNMNGDIVASGRKEGRQVKRVIEKDLLSEVEARF